MCLPATSLKPGFQGVWPHIRQGGRGEGPSCYKISGWTAAILVTIPASMNMEIEEDDEKRMELMRIEEQGCNNSSYRSIQVVLGSFGGVSLWLLNRRRYLKSHQHHSFQFQG
jgi:hypothetical protein